MMAEFGTSVASLIAGAITVFFPPAADGRESAVSLRHRNHGD